VKGLYLNTPPKPKQAYSKRKPRGHTTKSLKARKKEDLEQDLEEDLERQLTQIGGAELDSARVVQVEVDALCAWSRE
jgi:hypothetical protein